jgi:hypothetical protein
MRIIPPWGNSFVTVELVKHVVSGLPTYVCDTRRLFLMHNGPTESSKDVPNPPYHTRMSWSLSHTTLVILSPMLRTLRVPTRSTALMTKGRSSAIPNHNTQAVSTVGACFAMREKKKKSSTWPKKKEMCVRPVGSRETIKAWFTLSCGAWSC